MQQRKLFQILLTLFLLWVIPLSSKAETQSLLIRVDAFYGGPIHKTNEPYTLAGEVIFMGNGTFESVYLNWQQGEDGEIQTTFFDEINLNPYIPFRYEVPEKWIPAEAGVYQFNFWFSGLNDEDASVPASVEFQVVVEVYDQLAERQVVLLESFSSVNCGSCALVTPVLRNLVAQNPEQYAQIYYHPFFHENSPLYHFNPKDQDARRDFYEVFYTPYSVIGAVYKGGSELVDEQLFLYELNKWAGFDLQGEWFVENNNMYYQVSGNILMDIDNSDRDLRLFIAAIQDSVKFDTPPGSNGEKDFYNVMRFFAPDAQGIRITGDLFDETIEIQEFMSWNPELEPERITMFLFVQDLASREIFQTSFMDYNVFMDPNDPDDPDDPDDPTTIAEASIPRLMIYPNPASDLITISLNGNHRPETLRIYDIRGGLLMEKNLAGENKALADISGLSPGIYILTVTDGEQLFSQRISVIPKP